MEAGCGSGLWKRAPSSASGVCLGCRCRVEMHKRGSSEGRMQSPERYAYHFLMCAPPSCPGRSAVLRSFQVTNTVHAAANPGSGPGSFYRLYLDVLQYRPRGRRAAYTMRVHTSSRSTGRGLFDRGKGEWLTKRPPQREMALHFLAGCGEGVLLRLRASELGHPAVLASTSHLLGLVDRRTCARQWTINPSHLPKP